MAITYVQTKAELSAALTRGDAKIALVADIVYSAVLTIPSGTTLDIDGYNLYVTGLVENGSIAVSGGCLWADVITTAALTAAPTKASVQNLWAANEELLRANTKFHGIRLMGNLSTGANNPYNTGTNDAIYNWLRTNLPNMWEKGCLSMRYRSSSAAVKYGIPYIPDDKELDLNGYTLTLRATRDTLGDGYISTRGGMITLWYNGTTSSVGGQTLKNACAIANERPGIVKAFNQTSSAVQYNSFPIPSGVTLTLANDASVASGHVVTFMVANKLDFLRTGYTYASVFRMAQDFHLSGNVNIGSKSFDYNGCWLIGAAVITSGTVTKNGGGHADIATSAAEFASMLSTLDGVLLGADIRIDSNVLIQYVKMIDFNGHTLTCRSYTCNGTERDRTERSVILISKLNEDHLLFEHSGDTFQLILSNAQGKTLVWQSSDEDVATVSEQGLVRAVGNGSAVITVSWGDGEDERATCDVTVTIDNPRLNYEEKTLDGVGTTLQLELIDAPAAANLRWSSMYPTVADVDADGLVTARSAGTARISVAWKDEHGEVFVRGCVVTVREPQPFVNYGSNVEGLLEALEDFTRNEVKGLILPVSMQRGDAEQQFREPTIYKMRLPDAKAATKKAPYIIHRVLTSRQSRQSGQTPVAVVVVRSIFCVYCENEMEGALSLMNVMERIRVPLLKKQTIGNRYKLDESAGVETLIYDEDTCPYYAGEMVTTWTIPSIEREARQWL